MENNIDEVKVLQELIRQMEDKNEENPEYIIRNIELVNKIISVLESFKTSLIGKLAES